MVTPNAVFDAYVVSATPGQWFGVERASHGAIVPLASSHDLADLLSDLTARGLTVLLAVDGALELPPNATPPDVARPDAARNVWRRQAVGSLARWVVSVADHPWLADRTRLWPFEHSGRVLSKASDWQIMIAQVTGRHADPAFLALRDAHGILAHAFAGAGPVLDDKTVPVDIRNWIKDPAEIYRQSFATITAEAPIESLPAEMRPVATRLIHACGMTDVLDDLVWSDGAANVGRLALSRGAPVLVDAEMVAHGIIRRNLPCQNDVLCTLNDPGVAGAAISLGTTRSAMATELWRSRLEGSVVAIGNAPTALFRLLEMIADGAPPPAVILGFAVGFVGAAESKLALTQSGLPYIAVLGRRGGSAMAAAAVNALAKGLS